MIKPALVLSLIVATFAAPAAIAATPEEEAHFVAAVKKAFDDHKGAALAELTCWDRVTEKQRKGTEAAYTTLVEQKDVTWEFKLVDADLKFLDRGRKDENGVPQAPSLPVTRQLDMKFRDKDGKRTLGIIGYAVGEKDGKLLLAASAPAPAK
jgi:hypothetical protein